MEASRVSKILTEISYKPIRFLLLAISAFVTGVTLVITEIGLIQWISLIPMGIVLLTRASDQKIKYRHLYFEGAVFFYVYYLICYHWFTYLYPLDFVSGMTKGGALAVVILAWFGLSLFQALMGGLVFVACGIILRCHICQKITLLKPFLAAGLWSVFEWSQTIGWWGVPWGRLPIGQSDYIIGLQNASLLGSYFVTFMLVAVNLLLAFVLINAIKLKIGVIIVVSLLAFQYCSGALIYLLNDVEDGQKIKVACIQGNISSNEKWDSNKTNDILTAYSKYTAQAAAEGAELVVWPETAIPYDIRDEYPYFSDIFSYMAKSYGVYILVGAYVSNQEGESLNSLICFTPEGEQIENVYSKRHLVPFGEYVPLRSLIETVAPPLAELVLSSDDIAAGAGAQTIEIKDGISLGGLICFDSIYEELVRESIKDGADLICLSTNDSWFVDSAALNMHNAQAQIRAIESGRYVVRAANTGISSVINSRGEILDELDPLTEGMIVKDVYTSEKSTLWSVMGNSFVYLLILVYASIIAVEIYKRRRQKSHKECKGDNLL